MSVDFYNSADLQIIMKSREKFILQDLWGKTFPIRITLGTLAQPVGV